MLYSGAWKSVTPLELPIFLHEHDLKHHQIFIQDLKVDPIKQTRQKYNTWSSQKYRTILKGSRTFEHHCRCMVISVVFVKAVMSIICFNPYPKVRYKKKNTQFILLIKVISWDVCISLVFGVISYSLARNPNYNYTPNCRVDLTAIKLSSSVIHFFFPITIKHRRSETSSLKSIFQ